jgi:hypothetical protein
VFALRWARTAPREAGLSGEASLSAARSSLVTAKAAQEQVVLLQAQLRHSEPQPIVVLTIMASAAGLSGEPTMEVENVGDDNSFDIHVSSLQVSGTDLPDRHRMQFTFLPLLKGGEKRRLQYTVLRRIPGANADPMGQSITQSARFF